MIFIGIDDTDTLETQGTNQLARALVRRLGDRARDAMIVRHQLLFDRRVPYTSHNGSASILLRNGAVDDAALRELVGELRHGMLSWYVDGSDPGLCVTTNVPDAVVEFGRRCQREIMEQHEARELAARHGLHLEGLGGTEGGVIGALAAVGLAASGDDGRVVHVASWRRPDELVGPQPVEALVARGVDEIRCADSGELIRTGIVDVGKKLRPNRRGSRIVLFVRQAPASWPAPTYWHALRIH